MKTLNIEKMEIVEGGGFVDGACAVITITDAAIGVRILVGTAINPVLGTALIVASVGCAVYSFW
jgi:hypothetical protein